MYDGAVQPAFLTYKFTGKERDAESGLDGFVLGAMHRALLGYGRLGAAAGRGERTGEGERDERGEREQ